MQGASKVPQVPNRTYPAYEPLAPRAPERKSSIPTQAQVVQRSQYSSVQEVINNPKAYTSAAVQQVVRQILITADATNDERVFATRQILGHKINYTDAENVAACQFVIYSWNLFDNDKLHHVVGKVAEFQAYYDKQVASGLMREDAPHFSNDDLVKSAEIFIYINKSFFSTSKEDVMQFLAYAGNEAPLVNEYRDSLYQLLCKLNVDEKAEELWKTGKFVKAPALNIEIALFLLKHMNHQIFALWSGFAIAKAQTLQSVNSNLY